ncbi:MAG TPA: BatA domain-containing protein [Vicinamibacteria bacterium]|jgi:hypothetical protein
MPGFLAPAFFLGLLAMAVPVLVHLTHRESRETMAFPSLMFLRRVPFRTVRRQRLRHLALLALRCLALALLTAAFARPFVERGPHALTPEAGARERVILLDRSLSMGYRDRWARALAAAHDAVAGLGAADRASLLLFAEDAELVVPSASESARVGEALDEARRGYGVTRFAPAIKRAAERLEASRLPRKEAVLITDFQRSGWEGKGEARLPAGVALTWVDLSAADAANAAVTDVAFQREYVAGRETVSASARVIHRGPEAAPGRIVALEVEGRVMEEKKVDLPASGAATVSFSAVPLPTRPVRGVVRAALDDLAEDDAFHFVLKPGAEVPVLVLESVGGSALFLARALGIGANPRFRAEVRRDLPGGAELGRRRVVVLDGGAPRGSMAPLRRFVEEGGGLVVALGGTASSGGRTDEGAGLVPGRVGAVVERGFDPGGRLSFLDHAHAIFEPFAAPRSGDFSSARFVRYRRFDPAADAAVLARFDDGAPALVERKQGRGRVLVWTSSFDTRFGDLPLKPIFLPFVHTLVRHAAGLGGGRPWSLVGESVEVDDGEDAERIVAAPSGRRIRLPAGERFLRVEEPGFYEVRGRRGSSDPGLIAVNVNTEESNLAPIDPEELSAALTTPGSPRTGSAGRETLQERERRQAVWWYVLLGAVVLLLAEGALSNRLSRASLGEEGGRGAGATQVG